MSNHHPPNGNKWLSRSFEYVNKSAEKVSVTRSCGGLPGPGPNLWYSVIKKTANKNGWPSPGAYQPILLVFLLVFIHDDPHRSKRLVIIISIITSTISSYAKLASSSRNLDRCGHVTSNQVDLVVNSYGYGKTHGFSRNKYLDTLDMMDICGQHIIIEDHFPRPWGEHGFTPLASPVPCYTRPLVSHREKIDFRHVSCKVRHLWNLVLRFAFNDVEMDKSTAGK